MHTVKIPEPCHENWNEMTPTQKGAFCQKCAIDVVDFSKMSNEEVKRTLSEKKGQHLCGRFENDQLNDYNAEQRWMKNGSWKVYLSKFVAALVLGFGMSLFNGLNAQEHENYKYRTLGMVVHIEEPVEEDSIFVEDIKIVEDSIYEKVCEKDEELIHKKGKVKVVEAEPEEEIHTKGEILIVDTSAVEEIEEPVELEKPTEIIAPRYRIGDRANTTKKPMKTVKLEMNPTPISNAQYTSTIFPNPTSNSSELVVSTDINQNFDIVLFGSNGQIISEIFSGEILAGEQRFTIDLNTFATGIYFVQLVSAKGSEIIKIQKVD
ncbi:MAG: T9SS type A sorting domain-containing protein [Crocinitomicaceae bacterium]|nr:T9SS type A sorting domain-containing protein [Crocinitomicaceae bacterium]